MDITHLGHSSFKIRGRVATVITDPYSKDLVGIKFPTVEANIVTVSHQHNDHNNTSAVSGNPIIIAGPGEYEIKGVRIIGVASYHDATSGSERGRNTIYRIEIDAITIVHCGDLGHKLKDDDIELLSGADVLLIPVGGFYTISAEVAKEVVTQLEPMIIIPMHYNYASLDQKNFGKLTKVDDFIAAMGKDNIAPVPKLTITKDKLPVEQTIVVLE